LRQPLWELRTTQSGTLVQQRDVRGLQDSELRVVTQKAPSKAQLRELRFAWTIAKHVKSNAIVYTKKGATVGVGAGQTSRIMSARVAALKAKDEGLSLQGAVMASDAFFPFRDGIDIAARHRIRAIIQPGGSIRDDEVVAAADEHGIAMVFTGTRHFRH
jgi:phosphoribosylaminoimidazolecarboxamide formyltransferase/IMP cyclohydrolase